MPGSSHVDSRTRATVGRAGSCVISTESVDDQHQNSEEVAHLRGLCLFPSLPEFCRRCIRGDQDASAVVGPAFQKLCNQLTHREPVIEVFPVAVRLPWHCQAALHSDFADTGIGRFVCPLGNDLALGSAWEIRQTVSAVKTLFPLQRDKPEQIQPNTVQVCWHTIFELRQRVEQTHASK